MHRQIFLFYIVLEQSRYKLTVANEVTEQMTSIAQTATKDVKRSFPGHEDDKVKRVRLNEEVCNCLLLSFAVLNVNINFTISFIDRSKHNQ